ncbi:MAG: Rpn family recombination-promoting nuclease/putative transposase [Bacteroidota bacterium]
MKPIQEELPLLLRQPHDVFFKKGMGDMDVARNLLQGHLPQDIKSLLDWGAMQYVNKSMVKDRLSQLHADIVWRMAVQNSTAHVYALVEHQSKPDRLLPFRVTQYDVALIEQHLGQGYRDLPIITNLCLYAGKKTPYPYSIDLHDCFEDPALAREYMGKPFRLILIDLNNFSEAELAKHGTADMLQILLKRGIERDFLPWIKANPDMILRLFKRSYGIIGVYYMLGVEEHNDPEKLVEAISLIVPEKEEEIMTAAQKLWDRGKQEGRQESRLGIAKKMLQDNLPSEQISRLTGLNLAQIDRIGGGL